MVRIRFSWTSKNRPEVKGALDYSLSINGTLKKRRKNTIKHTMVYLPILIGKEQEKKDRG